VTVYLVVLNGRRYRIELQEQGADTFVVTLGSSTHRVRLHPVSGSEIHTFLIDDRSWDLLSDPIREGTCSLALRGIPYRAVIRNELQEHLASLAPSPPAQEQTLRSVMPGKIQRVHIKEGTTVREGTILLIIEAMKMETELRAPAAGTVGRIYVAAGDTVQNGQALVTIVP
jgi:biotin carboxyl carrier protein